MLIVEIVGRAGSRELLEKKLPDCATTIDSGLQSLVTFLIEYVYFNLLVMGQTKPEYLVLITLEEVGQASIALLVLIKFWLVSHRLRVKVKRDRLVNWLLKGSIFALITRIVVGEGKAETLPQFITLRYLSFIVVLYQERRVALMVILFESDEPEAATFNSLHLIEDKRISWQDYFLELVHLFLEVAPK